ncbi:MAG: phosphoserine phosphatase, partial [Corynebacterium sp.]|nr:phosphoserine phosphatase [Corynebacterium sp.]
MSLVTELSQIDNELSDVGQYVALRDEYHPAVITISGKDRPGVTAAFFRVLAANKVQVLDVEQSIFRGFLSLAAFVGIAPERVETVTSGLTDTLKVHGQSVNVELQDVVQSSRPRSSHVVVILGNPVDAIDLSRIGQTLADYDANIDTIRGIADYPVTGLELKVTVPDTSPGGAQKIRKALAALTTELNVDIAIERSGLLRRSKRLVCFDCDSTLITGEVIEMLAAHAGKE